MTSSIRQAGRKGGLGARIDSLIRAPIYVRLGEKPRVSLSPMVGPRQKGIALRLNF